MPKEFNKKVVVISGGTGALGRAVTLRFVKGGATVIVPFTSEMRLNAFLTDNPKIAQTVRFVRVDLANMARTKQFVEGVRDKEAGLDVVVNLAGGYRTGSHVSESRPRDFSTMLDINFKPAYNMCKVALPIMLDIGSGYLVNVGARAGVKGTAGNAAYSIAKSAVIRLTEAMADEVKSNGINVNCVLPGTIDTPDNRRNMPDADFSSWVTAEAVAEVILFLASPKARALHGASIPAYGTG